MVKPQAKAIEVLAVRFDCFHDTFTIAKVSKDLRVQGVNFFAGRGIYESYVSARPNAS